MTSRVHIESPVAEETDQRHTRPFRGGDRQTVRTRCPSRCRRVAPRERPRTDRPPRLVGEGHRHRWWTRRESGRVVTTRPLCSPPITGSFYPSCIGFPSAWRAVAARHCSSHSEVSGGVSKPLLTRQYHGKDHHRHYQWQNFRLRDSAFRRSAIRWRWPEWWLSLFRRPGLGIFVFQNWPIYHV